MTCHPARVLPPVGILTVLILGCAHGQSSAPPPPSPSTAASDEIAQQRVVSLEQMLEGRIAGVTVTRGLRGGISVRLLGPTSFFLSSEPLYVVDDVPVETGPGGSLTWLNPQDIASIAVLKDPASTAIFGVRGANGVIVIKTRGSH